MQYIIIVVEELGSEIGETATSRSLLGGKRYLCSFKP